MDLQLDRTIVVSPAPAPAPSEPRPPPSTQSTQTTAFEPSSKILRMGACMGRCIADKSSCLKRWRSTDEHETELMTDNEDDSKTQRRKNKERKHIFRIIKFRRKNQKQFVDKFMERQDLNYSRLSRAPTADLTDIQLQSLDAQTLLVTAAANNVTTTNTFVPAVSSRTSSSLDLEWEHEYHQQNHPNRGLSRSWLFIDGAEADNNPDDGETSDDNKPLFNSPPSDDISGGCCTLPKQYNRSSNNRQMMTSQMAKSNSNLQQQLQQHQQQPNFTRTSSRTSWSHISTPESLEWDIDEEQTNQMRLEDDNLDHETLELLHQIEMLKNKVLNETGDGLDGIEFPNNGDS